MPESHPGIQFTSRRKVRRSSGPSESRTAAAVGKSAHRSGARSGPSQSTQYRPYRISGGRHPEKFAHFPDMLGSGQVDNTHTKAELLAKNRGAIQKSLLKRALLNYVGGTPIGRGLEAGHAALIYDKLKPLFGPGAKMPNYEIADLTKARTAGGGKVAGQAVGHHVKLDPSQAINLLPLIAPNPDWGKNLVAHETAHTQQQHKFAPTPEEQRYHRMLHESLKRGVPAAKKLWRTPEFKKAGRDATRASYHRKSMIEGGADAFANAVAPILGAKPIRKSPRSEYGHYGTTFKRATGKRYTLAALQSQFPKARKAYGK